MRAKIANMAILNKYLSVYLARIQVDSMYMMFSLLQERPLPSLKTFRIETSVSWINVDFCRLN